MYRFINELLDIQILGFTTQPILSLHIYIYIIYKICAHPISASLKDSDKHIFGCLSYYFPLLLLKYHMMNNLYRTNFYLTLVSEARKFKI